MKLVVFGLSITSSWGNGHATTYRALLRALAQRGHRIHFIEKDVEWYRNHRDLPHPNFCTVQLYESWARDAPALRAASSDADAILIGSYFPDAIAASHALFATARCPILFYDIDTPITLAALRVDGHTAYLDANDIAHYAAYLSFTGGPALQELEQRFGAKKAFPLFCSVDPDLYGPAPSRPEYQADLSYLGTYAADRQPKLLSLLDASAALLPDSGFLVAGPQYPSSTMWQPNVRHLDHIAPADHPAFYSSSRFTLNLTRDDMVVAGYSPSVRLFEASACGAALLSDDWPGLSDLLTPGKEILLPQDAAEVADILEHTTDAERLRLGTNARNRILSEHTAAHRAVEFEALLSACS